MNLLIDERTNWKNIWPEKYIFYILLNILKPKYLKLVWNVIKDRFIEGERLVKYKKNYGLCKYKIKKK